MRVGAILNRILITILTHKNVKTIAIAMNKYEKIKSFSIISNKYLTTLMSNQRKNQINGEYNSMTIAREIYFFSIRKWSLMK